MSNQKENQQRDSRVDEEDSKPRKPDYLAKSQNKRGRRSFIHKIQSRNLWKNKVPA